MSEESKPIVLTDAQRTRFHASPDVWLATVKPEPAAHLVPIWAVLIGDIVYMTTGPKTQKVRNLRAHPRCTVAIADTRHVLILEGKATIMAKEEVPAPVLPAFQAKYEWSPGSENDGEWVLIVFTPTKVLTWGGNEG